MNNQINNTSSSSTIDLSEITTYGELKNALPSTGHGRVPGINQLRDTAVCLLRRDTGSCVIEIYDNGFFTFEECEMLTVFGVDRCERPETYTYNGKREAGMESQDFSSYPWDLILESAGSARLAHNSDSRELYRGEISIDAPESENNISLSVRPEHEIQEEVEAAVEWHAAKIKTMKAALEKLTEKQRTIMMLDRVDGLTQEQIAECMGISRRTLREHLEAIEKKLKKYTANTRH